jgi:hypothetical protein
MSRMEAARAGLSTYQGVGPCKYGHPPIRLTSTGQCAGCEEERREALKAVRKLTHPVSKREAGILRMQGLKSVSYTVDIRDVDTLNAIVLSLNEASAALRARELAESRRAQGFIDVD